MDTTLLILITLIFVHSIRTYENLALNKPAWQTPFLNNSWRAEFAVDGNTKLCTMSADNQSTAEWHVDLGNVSSVREISIHYRTDDIPWDENNNYTSRFLGFSVYLSNTTNKEEGILCFKDRGYTRSTIPNPTNITCINHGRYLIYYNNRTLSPFPVEYSTYAFSELCEVQVYGCPTSSYGENCSSPCPENCQTQHCDIGEGKCLSCLSGYTGPRCDRKCKDGTYGFKCLETCGFCFGNKSCHFINGLCSNGCINGFWGERCIHILSQQSESDFLHPAVVSFLAVLLCSIVISIFFIIKVQRLISYISKLKMEGNYMYKETVRRELSEHVYSSMEEHVYHSIREHHTRHTYLELIP